MAYHSPEDNLCHHMAFRLKIVKVGKFLTSWSLTKLIDFGTHALPLLRGSTLILKPSRSDRRNAGKIFFFLFSLSLFIFLFFSLPVYFSLLLIQHIPLSLFSPHPLSFSFFFSSSFFLIFSSLSFSLFSSFLISFDFLLIQIDQSGGNFPSLSSHATCLLHTISLFSSLFFFPFITSFNTWINVSHLFQVHHMAHAMCHSPRVPCGIHRIMPCVTQHPVP